MNCSRRDLVTQASSTPSTTVVEATLAAAVGLGPDALPFPPQSPYSDAVISHWPNAPKQDEVKIILIGDDFEVIARLNLAARPYGLRYYQLATLAYIRCHQV